MKYRYLYLSEPGGKWYSKRTRLAHKAVIKLLKSVLIGDTYENWHELLSLEGFPVQFHALMFPGGEVWDRVNGWRVPPGYTREDFDSIWKESVS